jgi:hypothetical protein
VGDHPQGRRALAGRTSGPLGLRSKVSMASPPPLKTAGFRQRSLFAAGEWWFCNDRSHRSRTLFPVPRAPREGSLGILSRRSPECIRPRSIQSAREVHRSGSDTFGSSCEIHSQTAVSTSLLAWKPRGRSLGLSGFGAMKVQIRSASPVPLA